MSKQDLVGLLAVCVTVLLIVFMVCGTLISIFGK